MHVLAVAPLALLPFVGTTPGTAPPSDPELAQLLLTLDDMPAGWVDQGSGGVTELSGDECESEFLPKLRDVSDYPSAAVGFSTAIDPLEGNLLAEFLVDLRYPDVATAYVAGFPASITECTNPDEATITEISFPDLGDASTALLVTPSPNEDVNFSTAVVLVAIDERLIFLIGLGDGADPELLDDVARTAVERVE